MIIEERLSRAMHKRATAILMVALATVYVWVTGLITETEPVWIDKGIGLSGLNEWQIPTGLSTVLNIGLNALIIVLMMALNRSYNVLRSLTWLPAGLFAIMQAATPTAMLSLGSGTLVCVVVLLCLYLLFGIYGRPTETRIIFAVFFLLSLGTAFQYCFAPFILLFWFICMQLKVYNLRTFTASLMGVASVWILLLGFGIVDIDRLQMPSLHNVFAGDLSPMRLYLPMLALVTAILLIAAITMNFMKAFAYNAHARAMNGALVLLSFVILLMMVIDSQNMPAYMPLLNVSAAMQITHYFVNHRFERQYIAILAVLFVYIAIYLRRLYL